MTLEYLNGFSKNSQIPNFNKIRPLGTVLFHEDGQTGRSKPIVALRNFADAPKNHWLYQYSNPDSLA
jgi:hypothetical protein